MTEEEYPKLRYGLETVPIEHQGQRMILIRDRMGFTEDSLLISYGLAGLLAGMNGRNSFRDLQAAYMRMTGELLFTETLRDILSKLDESLFLENERFIRHAAETAARFQRSPTRPMRHAGRSYPAEPELLRERLTGYFSEENGGPGAPAERTEGRRLVGLVAPHIDIQAGGPCFAHAYKALLEAPCPETWVILGTGHEPIENFFALTAKDFETPLGTIACDRQCCEKLIAGSESDILAGEYSHSREHTIEFQAVFLAFAQPSARIVPILCSFSHEDRQENRDRIDRTASSIRALIEDRSRSVGIIASVDLAHVGPRYGDAFQPGEDVVREHLEADEEILALIGECDAEGFMERIVRERNRRNICGTAPLYVMAKALKGLARGSVLMHTHAVVDNANSFVTFAGMAFYAE